MTPVIDRGTIYGSSGAGSGDAELRAIELDSGKVLWREPGLGRSTMLWVDGKLIVLTERGRLLVVEDGRLVGIISRRDLMRALEGVEQQMDRSGTRSTYDLMDERHRALD